MWESFEITSGGSLRLFCVQSSGIHVMELKYNFFLKIYAIIDGLSMSTMILLRWTTN